MDTSPHPSKVSEKLLVIHHGFLSFLRHRQGWQDIIYGLKLWKLAISLGWLDIKLRYRGSVVGPLWMTLSSALMVGSMGLIYSTLFKMVLRDYLPFLALSMILWQNVLSAIISDACTCFLQANDTIHSIKLPYFVQALRTMVRNFIVLAHNIIVPLVVFVIFRVWPGWVGLLSIPALALWLIDGIAVCLLLGSLCARYRDIPPIVNSIMQVVFYVTPIIWQPSQLAGKDWWLPFNPFYPLIEILRLPLLGGVPSLFVWECAFGYSFVLCLVAWFIFARARPRLAFWI